jgi:hypothetical protein
MLEARDDDHYVRMRTLSERALDMGHQADVRTSDCPDPCRDNDH